MADIRIRYSNADSSLAKEQSFLSQLVSKALDGAVHVVHGPRETVDLQLSSVQVSLATRLQHVSSAVTERLWRRSPSVVDARWDRVNPQPQGRARSHVWFTGENVRPPSTGWDGTLSFDIDPLAGKNAYLPLWWYSIGILGPAQSMFMDPPPTIEGLLAGRRAGPIPERFAVALINHPHPMRFHAIRELRKYGNVEVYGRAVGKSLPNKASLTGRYKFMLCFENDLYPGYVTEKAFEAWAMGTVPLWWGEDPAYYLNPQAVINAANFATLEEFAETVGHVSRDRDAWIDSFEQALVLREPDLDPALELIRRICTA